MKNLSLLIKPASSLCNLRCKYCFYADESKLREIKSYGIMKDEVKKALIDNVFSDIEDGTDLTFAFQGGEPTMAGIEWFQKFIAEVNSKVTLSNKKPNINYAIQTNGILIDEKWCEFLKENNFLVGLSLDCGAAFHNDNRVDSKGKGSFSKVMKTKQMLDKYKVEYNILCVLTDNLARYPQKVWNFLVDNNISYVQFVPCLGELENDSFSNFSLTPQRFSSFYTKLLILWVDELKKGHYISVKFFDDLFNLLTKRQITACGFTGSCQTQFVVEGDGSVYPCDFYSLDEWKIGDINVESPSKMLSSPIADKFLKRERTEGKICSECNYKNFCNGGCVRMKNNMYLNGQEDFCGYMDFLEKSKELIEFVCTRLL